MIEYKYSDFEFFVSPTDSTDFGEMKARTTDVN